MARPPARLRAKLKKEERKVNHLKKKQKQVDTLIEQLQLKTQKFKHQQKEKLRKERTRHFEEEDADKLARAQLMHQIESVQKELSRKDDKIAEQEDLLALVLDQACARE